MQLGHLFGEGRQARVGQPPSQAKRRDDPNSHARRPVNLEQNRCEVTLQCLRERVQPRAGEQDQHEKNSPPVQAYREPVEGWSPRVDWRLLGPGAVVQRRKVHLTRTRLVEQRIRLHAAAPLFPYLTASKTARCAALFPSASPAQSGHSRLRPRQRDQCTSRNLFTTSAGPRARTASH